MENKIKIKLYLPIVSDGVLQPDGSLGTQNISDYHVNLPLKRQMKLLGDYVDVQFDPLRLDMQRQLINPWFIEFGFFETIKTTGITGTSSNNLNVLVPISQNLIRKANIFSITINR